MSSLAPKRARDLFRKHTVERRLQRFSEQLDSRAIEASKEFHLRHWAAVAERTIRMEHGETYYRGLLPNLESAIAEHPEDDFPLDLQRALLADLAFMEGHLQAYREIIRLLQQACKTDQKE